MKFRFKDKEDPRGYVSDLAGDLHDYPVNDVLSAGYLLSSWRPDLIREVLDHLTPGRMRVLVCAQKYADKCSDTEKWYGAKYNSEKMSKEMLENFTSCGLNEKYQLPGHNAFIPVDFSLAPRDTSQVKDPAIIQEDSMGRLWFKQDNEFLFPKNYINIKFTSPIAESDPHHSTLNSMFSAMLTDELNE